MRVRSFKAPSAAEAILRARAEMGDRARILATKRADRGVELLVAEENPAATSDDLEALRREIRELRERLAPAAPPGLEDLRDRLAKRGIAGPLLDRVLAAAAPHRGVSALAAASAALARLVPVLPPRAPHPGGARVV